MSNTKHTPGPWRASKSAAGYHAIYHGKAANMVAQLGALHGTDESALLSHCGNAKANARLIAAAPELLAALIEMVDGTEDVHTRFTMARAAIAKATGTAI